MEPASPFTLEPEPDFHEEAQGYKKNQCRADQGAAAEFVAGLTAWLSGPEAPAPVEQVWSPILGDEQTKA
ncbi:MAG: hypothetical protein ABIK28_16635, partial [Planctomycetota bacterium]